LRIKIRLYGLLKDLTGSNELSLEIPVESTHLRDILEELVRRYPSLNTYISVKEGSIQVRGLSILVNGQHAMFLGGDMAEIKDGYVIDILPPVSGGFSSNTYQKEALLYLYLLKFLR